MNWLGRIVGGGIVMSLTACQWSMDVDIKPLAGPYSIATDYEGFSFLQYGNPWFEKPIALVGQLDSTGIAGSYLVVCRSQDPAAYFLLPLTATNERQAQASLLGPFTETAYRRKLYQLRGDSLFRLAPIPRYL